MVISPLLDVLPLLGERGWNIETGAPAAALCGRIDEFPAVLAFARRVRRCVAPDGQAWWFGSEDFLAPSGDGWDFLETQVALASAEGDEAWSAQIRAFWSAHLPFAMSTRGDYGYLAIDRAGRIWSGRAPELEQPRLVAEDMDGFAREFAHQASSSVGPLHDEWLRTA